MENNSNWGKTLFKNLYRKKYEIENIEKCLFLLKDENLPEVKKVLIQYKLKLKEDLKRIVISFDEDENGK